MKERNFALYVRNFIFGAEDSLVSTVGLLAGISSAGISQKDIVISGIVLIFVEAFSMAVGSFLSERTVEESESNFKLKNSKSSVASVIMLFSYLVWGLIPLLPYLVADSKTAFYWSIGASLVALLVLGIISAKVLKTNIQRNTVRMVVIGGFAIALGVTVGTLVK